ncbi:DNA topoisomerase III [Rhodopirellula maiorica SM1]|uniref:DNA topoisomerase n=1 Tax=Rhodopirellula maiorica SM1 TaxID=1265738 RepID=M5RB18_9BACT|nr:type IA DNA topoisomerase [Rhodopirellula maiorica]EMI16251.1 DNA topoisomerase III [Rhodopirellula maiorica SM1]
MKVILAEKPSVARDLASFLSASARRDGFFEGGGYQVTWAFGHLVELKEPGDYDPALKRWTLESLPFIPEKFQLRLRGDDGAKKQFAVIKRLFRDSSSLICATDAGREGELIFRYIQTLTGCTNKPAERLWLSSLTRSAIDAAFRRIRPLSDYDNLYAAAKCRSQADWVVGINATRNYTVRYRSMSERGASGLLWSLGRVQTPVLAMITRRDDEIRTFQSEPFWELITQYREVHFRYTGKRFDKQERAQSVLELAGKNKLTIQKIQSRTEKSQPPQLYDLTELQRDMNRRFGISAAETLAAAQALYEAKLITYPRTDSTYLTKDMRKDIPGILRQLRSVKAKEIDRLDLAALPFTSRIVNDAKVTDHHAIIPTGANAGTLRGREQKVYDAIVVRFIAAFYPPCEKEITTADATAGEVVFRARGVRVVTPGWTQLYPRKTTRGEKSEEQQSLPEFKKGESGKHKPFIKSGQTSPPKHFTENTLLGAMDTAGKLVEEAELKEALREKGLGTPATRAATIETLLNRNYIVRDKKNVLATDLGRYLVAIVRDHNLTSPELTGEWEAKLKKIEMGQLSPDVFMREIGDYTRAIIQSSAAAGVDHEIYGPCPRCGKNVIAGKRAFGCSGWRKGCKFVLQPAYRDADLSMDQVRELLQLGVTKHPLTINDCHPFLLAMSESGMLVEIPVPQGSEQDAGTEQAARKRTKNKSGTKRAAAKSSGTRQSKTKREPKSGTSEIGVCPLCGSPVVEQPKSYACSRWRDGCGLTIWKTISGKKISISSARKLLRNGETAMLKGFKSKAGKSFDAKLKLVEGKVRFDF